MVVRGPSFVYPRWHCGAEVVGNEIFVIGGCSRGMSGQTVESLEFYPPENDENDTIIDTENASSIVESIFGSSVWRERKDLELPSTETWGHASCCVGSCIVVIGGCSSDEFERPNNYLKSVHVLDPLYNSSNSNTNQDSPRQGKVWRLPSVSLPRSASTVVHVPHHCVLILGGFCGSTMPLHLMERLDLMPVSVPGVTKRLHDLQQSQWTIFLCRVVVQLKFQATTPKDPCGLDVDEKLYRHDYERYQALERRYRQRFNTAVFHELSQTQQQQGTESQRGDDNMLFVDEKKQSGSLEEISQDAKEEKMEDVMPLQDSTQSAGVASNPTVASPTEEPRLFVLSKVVLSGSSRFRAMFQSKQRYMLHIFDSHTLQVTKKVPVEQDSHWLEAVAPALATSMLLIRLHYMVRHVSLEARGCIFPSRTEFEEWLSDALGGIGMRTILDGRECCGSDNTFIWWIHHLDAVQYHVMPYFKSRELDNKEMNWAAVEQQAALLNKYAFRHIATVVHDAETEASE